MPTRYDTAQICLRGHLITGKSETSPHQQRKFCSADGSEVISQCPACDGKIRGAPIYRVERDIDGNRHPVVGVARGVPAYRPDCGKPFPWTEERLKAAHDLIEELDELTRDEKTRLNESISELARDSAQTPVAVTRIKKIALKIGKESWTLLQKIITDVASDTVKKTIGLP